MTITDTHTFVHAISQWWLSPCATKYPSPSAYIVSHCYGQYTMPTLSAGLVISTQQTQSGCKDINGTENIGDKHSMKFRTVTVTLPVTTAIQSFRKTQDGVPSNKVWLQNAQQL